MMSKDTVAIHELTAVAIREMVASGQHTAEELAQAFLDYAEPLEEKLHAFAYLNREAVMVQAQILDRGRAIGGDLGKLAGVPIALKDAIDTFDMPTEFGSASLAGRQPRWDAKVAKLLRNQGAIIFGKTAMPAFCLGQPAQTRNPHNLEHTPGGSSSGSAAAVAAGMVPVAIGTQTAGSVIRPASFCGVIGFKPTRGLISRSGLQPLCDTIDQVGVFGRNIEDVALVAQTLIAADDDDATTKGVLPRVLVDTALSEPPFKPKFVFVKTPQWEQMDPEAREAFDALAEAMGEETPTIELPTVANTGIDNLKILMDAEFAVAMDEHMRHSGEQVDERTKSIVERGRQVNAFDYLKAKRAIEPVTAGFDEFFERFDAIITPASLGPAPKGLDSTGDSVMNALWSYTGMPAITLPLLQSEAGLPIGIQLVGARHDDARLLRTANWLINNFDAITGES
ncbi:amidase [Orrella daihaiensis]|uniref:Amidase n=1 Tax=Orrella daihaiensis TaxID=2782176 RepID=A0ABY4AM07_9BURK|nr:amidase [Orrella daihaiensis]UOD51302.1 amidase [Orrella daihaiensis]